MGEMFFDRISGKSIDRLPDGRTVPGRWLLRVHPGKEVFLNSVPVQTEMFLVPDLSGNWRVIEGEGAVQHGRMFRKIDPDEVEADSIRAMGLHLDDLIEKNKTWFEWLDVVPLLPGLSDGVNLLPLEKQIRELFGYLEAVCMKPKAHLNVEVERVQVAKARRIPIKAASHLASHTEDWERPLIRGVLPKRILSEIRRDQVDIYENRVAARLIDHLIVYLDKRIRVILKLQKVFQDKEDYSSEVVEGTHFRNRRILELWGQSVDANEGRGRAEATLKELKRLKYRLMGLMDSRLYRDIPHQTYVAPTLRTTNILTNDQNYRRIAELWRAWVNAGHAETKTPAEVNREAQEVCGGFGRFALLLVVRALDQLGYEIREQDLEIPVMTAGRQVLKRHGAAAECEWDNAGRVSIAMGESRLTVVALPVSLGNAVSDEQVQEVLEHVIKAVDDQAGMTIVLYAGDANEPRQKLSQIIQRQIQTVGNDPRAQLGDQIGFLPVSPWDIGSVERVSRAIRWFVDSARFNSYPPRFEVSEEARGVVDSKAAGAWLEISDGGGSITMRGPPREDEWNLLKLKLDHRVNMAREEHKQATDEHERLLSGGREAGPKRKTGSLNQQKRTARQRKEATERQMVGVEQLRDDLDRAIATVKSLLVCPVCPRVADPVSDFKPRREKDCFYCKCRECRTRWEIRMCKNEDRYAVILPRDEFVETKKTNIGWEDRIYGSDLLALPGRTANDKWGFVCPFCGEIS